MRTLLALVVGAGLLLASSATSTGLFASTASAAKTQALPSFTLTNQSGQSVGVEQLRGYATLVNFMFTNCRDVCPLTTAQLAKVQARARADGIGSRIRFVSITVDPAKDTPDVLKRYAIAYGADLATWHFLTGPSAAIARLTREIGLLTGRGDRVGHTSLVLYVDTRGEIVERYTGVDLEPERVLPKLRRLLG